MVELGEQEPRGDDVMPGADALLTFESEPLSIPICTEEDAPLWADGGVRGTMPPGTGLGVCERERAMPSLPALSSAFDCEGEAVVSVRFVEFDVVSFRPFPEPRAFGMMSAKSLSLLPAKVAPEAEGTHVLAGLTAARGLDEFLVRCTVPVLADALRAADMEEAEFDRCPWLGLVDLAVLAFLLLEAKAPFFFPDAAAAFLDAAEGPFKALEQGIL